MKKIDLEPGSGVKHAGKWVTRDNWEAPTQLAFVSDHSIFTEDYSNGEVESFAWKLDDGDPWYEVDPPTPTKPKMVRMSPKIMSCVGPSSMNRPIHALDTVLREENPGLPIVIELDQPLTECMDGRYELRGKLFVEVPAEGDGK